MPKYGKIKYGKEKYGPYNLQSDKRTYELRQLTYWRLSSINSNKQKSSHIVKTKLELGNTTEYLKIRLKTNNGDWVCQDSLSVPGFPTKIRIKSISRADEESQWVECNIGAVIPINIKGTAMKDLEIHDFIFLSGLRFEELMP